MWKLFTDNLIGGTSLKAKIEHTWFYNDKAIRSSKDFPDGAYGFIYLIEFSNGRKYIGKKQLWSIRSMKPLKDGSYREGTLRREYRNTGKGFRQAIDIVKKESDWKTYKGSADECKTLEVSKKIILEWEYTPLELTFAEVRYLFKYDVLGTEEYINDNISGTFYKENLDDYYRRISESKACCDQ